MAADMHAMAVDAIRHVLVPTCLAVPEPAAGEVLLRVRACGVCRTDLHILDAELPVHRDGVVPGHEVVGEVVRSGDGATRFATGDRVGVPWLGGTCGACPFCAMHRENLCDRPVFTGYDRDGGYAEFCTADERYCIPLPARHSDLDAAPLLCAGLIGFRTWRMAGGAGNCRIGIWGFGAAGHLLCQFAVAQGQEVYAFTRPGDSRGQAFARSLGAAWAGGSDTRPPVSLDANLIFAAVGALIPPALRATRKGGAVVCGGIHMSTIPAFAYDLLWGERELRSVANLTREDGRDFFAALEHVPIRTHARPYPLAAANDAARAVRAGTLDGAAVLVP